MRHRRGILLLIWLLITAMWPGTLPAFPGHDGLDGVPARLKRFAESLRRSCAGRSVLEALSRPRAAGLTAGVAILAEELELGVRTRTGIPVDAEDSALYEAARELRRLPKRVGCNPTVAVMALLDEWSARATGAGRGDRQNRIVYRLRASRLPRKTDLGQWLESRFPLLYRDAAPIIRFLS